MCAGIGQGNRRQSRHAVQAPVELLARVAAAPPALDVGIGALDPQQRRGDGSARWPGSRRRGRAPGWCACAPGRPAPASARWASGRAQCARQPGGLVGDQARVVGRSRAATSSTVGVARMSGCGWRSSSSQGARRSRRLPAGRRQAEALQVDQTAHARRAHAGVAHHDIAAHAVAQQVDGLAWRQRRRAGRRGRPGSRGTSSCRCAGGSLRPKPRQSGATMWRADRRPRPQGVDDELERRADVHPAVQQHQGRPQRRGQVGVAPLEQVLAQAAQRHELGVRLRGDGLDGGRGRCHRRTVAAGGLRDPVRPRDSAGVSRSAARAARAPAWRAPGVSGSTPTMA